MSVQLASLTFAPPDNHLAASPDCRMRFSRNRRTKGGGGCPTISAGIVSPARVQIASPKPFDPPQMIISLPVQTAVWEARPVGALVVLVAVQLFVLGLYLPPVFKTPVGEFKPPHTIISLPVHTAACRLRLSGASVMLVAVQLSLLGLYFPPVFKSPRFSPPQTIISLPVQTAV